MHEVLVNRLGDLSLHRKSVVRLTDRPDMTLDVYRGRKTTIQQRPRQCLTCCTLSQAVSAIVGKSDSLNTPNNQFHAEPRLRKEIRVLIFRFCKRGTKKGKETILVRER